ncbi:hypothetical protein XELAEV_18022284mg [Xenopus laevis]|uniref:Uncharacterized protein n=1 Tax=Xenopus laevis TaxID=8355 RepID=A0A974D235_XENLA|nr:hypothetical protein XELAEV_18022284mg [Xenopus laevis]
MVYNKLVFSGATGKVLNICCSLTSEGTNHYSKGNYYKSVNFLVTSSLAKNKTDVLKGSHDTDLITSK